MIVVNGEARAQRAQFSLDGVEVVTTTVDLEEVRSKRYEPSRGLQVVRAPNYGRTETSFSLSPEGRDVRYDKSPSKKQKIRLHAPREEIASGPACWLWDYLQRSRLAGFRR